MKYRIMIDCPNDKKIVARIIYAASKAGAGEIGNYSHCATVLNGWSTWKSEKGAHPGTGKIGKVSRVSSVRIEMECPKGKLKKACFAIRKAHPYEEPFIQVARLEEFR